jgi:hypothetical protein
LTQPELERANQHMHARFLSVSDQIFQELARLQRLIEAAPPSVRAPALAAAQQIASTQQWLRAQTEHLPSSPLQRFEILRGSLDAQQSVLRQLSIVVERYAPHAWPQDPPAAPMPPQSPWQAQEPVRAPAPPQARVPPPDEQRRRAQSDAAALARYFQAAAIAPSDHRLPSHGSHWPGHADHWGGRETGWHGGAGHWHTQAVYQHGNASPWQGHGNAAYEVPAWSRQSHAAPASHHTAGRGGGLRNLFQSAHQQVNSAGPRSLGWVTALVAAATFGYGMLPHESGLRQVFVKSVETSSPTTGSGAAPSRRELAARPESPTSSPVEAAPPPQHPEPVAPAVRSEPGIVVDGELPLLSASRSALPPAPVPVAAPDAATPARQMQPAAKEHAPPPQAQAQPVAPPPKAAAEGFVPVVFTHRDEAAAMQTFVTLQRLFPPLADLQGEAQPADFGHRGVWHRLVVLPPKPRRQAMKLCDQLLAAGYDRCWVKAY